MAEKPDSPGQAKQRQDGFDCEFIEEPPESLQPCPVCLQILREPYQVTCCGKNFCKSCIDTVKSKNKPCPTCNKEGFSSFPDKKVKLELYDHEVQCSNKEKGCEWTGKLRQLDVHLNLDPSPEKQEEGCPYAGIKCFLCSETHERQQIQAHQIDDCPKRLFSCEYCHNYESDYEDVTKNHWPVCGYFPMECPNKCGTKYIRQEQENHISKECPLQLINCDFQSAGCQVTLPRKDMQAHLNDPQAAKEHVHQLMNKTRGLENENEQLKETMKKEVKQVRDDLQREALELREALRQREENERRLEQQSREVRETLQHQQQEQSTSIKRLDKKYEERYKELTWKLKVALVTLVVLLIAI